MTTELQTSQFMGMPVTLVEHNAQLWISAEDAGKCLGFGAGNERKGISKIYERNADEFSAQDTCVVKLTTQVQARDIRVFSVTGCNKLGFFASTPKAKEFRHWAAQTLANKTPVTVSPAIDTTAELHLLREVRTLQQQVISLQNEKLADLQAKYEPAPKRKAHTQMTAEEIQLMRALSAQGMSGAAIARQTGRSPASVSHMIRTVTREVTVTVDVNHK